MEVELQALIRNLTPYLDLFFSVQQHQSRNIVDRFVRLANLDQWGEKDLRDLHLTNVELNFLKTSPGPEADLIKGHVLAAIASAKENLDGQLTPFQSFALGGGLTFVVGWMSSEDLTPSLIDSILTATETGDRSARFLIGFDCVLQLYEQRILDNLGPGQVDRLIDKLCQNLTGASCELREKTLDVLSNFSQVAGFIKDAREIQLILVNLDNERDIARRIRRLMSSQEVKTERLSMKCAVAYCYGLLQVHFAPLWDEACDLLDALRNHGAEPFIVDHGLKWLQHQQLTRSNANTEDSDTPAVTPNESGSQCATLFKLKRTAARVSSEFGSASDKMRIEFEKDNYSSKEFHVPPRSQALRLFSRLAPLVEKNSRSFVPIFLEFLGSEPIRDDELDSYSNTVLGSSSGSANDGLVSREDRKAVLRILGQFANPVALYRSEDVRSKLLDILSSGDTEMQRLSLKGLLTWKSPSFSAYEATFKGFLDDRKLKDELTTFLSSQQEDSFLRGEHREQLMLIALHLLYGRMVSQTGSKSGDDQESRRKVILLSIARFGEDDFRKFLDLALHPLENLDLYDSSQSSCIREERLVAERAVPFRKRFGMLKMIESILQSVSTFVKPFVRKLIDAVVYCLVQACRQLESTLKSQTRTEKLPNSSGLKALRTQAIKCLYLLFMNHVDVEWGPYGRLIYEEVISPRIQTFSIENSQSISHSLRMLSAWSLSRSMIHCFAFERCALLESLASCLTEPSSQDQVRVYILQNIIQNVLSITQNWEESTGSSLEVVDSLKQHLRSGVSQILLTYATRFLESSSSTSSIEVGLETVIDLSHFMNRSIDSGHVIKCAIMLLQRPSREVNPRLKGRVLQLLDHFIPLHEFNFRQDHDSNVLTVISSLFGFFKDAQNRTLLVKIIENLACQDGRLEQPAKLCAQFNSFSSSRLDRPDYDSRISALNSIVDAESGSFDALQWQPILHNLLFLVKDEQEFSMRSTASLALRRFVQMVTNDAKNEDSRMLIAGNLIPALQRGMHEQTESIRMEYLLILAEVVKKKHAGLEDLSILSGNDEESSIFTNILHVQEHRRLRALRRLAAASKRITGRNMRDYILPMMERILSDSESKSQNIVNEALETLQAVVQGLEWSGYRAFILRIINRSSTLGTKFGVKFLSASINGYANACRTPDQDLVDGSSQTDKELRSRSSSNLRSSLPSLETRLKFWSSAILSKLLEFVHFKDESTVDLRISVTVPAVKIIMTFPDNSIGLHLPPILMDVSNILKSKAQDARDATRKVLTEVAAIIGPNYLGFLFKQLRGCLLRGSQLHVLSYTIHAILTSATPSIKVGDLDYCLETLTPIIVDDIFGARGQEKEAEEYVSHMKEVKKKNISYDSLELLSSIISIESAVILLRPIQDQLAKLRIRAEKIDEYLRRVREGLRRNEGSSNPKILMLCYEVLRGSFDKMGPPVQAKMATFSIETLRRVVDKQEELKTAKNLSAFCPKISECLKHKDDDLRVAAMRLLVSIIKVPLEGLDEGVSNYIKLAKHIIESEPSTQTPISQAALRLVSAIIRERPDAVIKQSHFETHIASILARIRPDLEEPAKSGDRDRQVAAFNFLRAVCGRGVLIKEVYEVMDIVRQVMISSREHPIPELSRSVYSRFILDYFAETSESNDKKRHKADLKSNAKGLSRQVEFLSQNLQHYPQAQGRFSVMEVIAFILHKKDQANAQPLLVEFFLPLVVTLTADSSDDCRSSARALLYLVFERADAERTKMFIQQMRDWTSSDTKSGRIWIRAGFQCWNIHFELEALRLEKRSLKTSQLQQLAKPVVGEVERTIQSITAASDITSPDQVSLLVDSLALFKRFSGILPSLVFRKEIARTWQRISESDWPRDRRVHLLRSELQGAYLREIGCQISEQNNEKLKSLPLTVHSSLSLTQDDAVAMLDSNIGHLAEGEDQQIVTEGTKNLAAIGRIGNATSNGKHVVTQLISKICAGVRQDLNGPSAKSKLTLLNLLDALCKSTSASLLRGSSSQTILLTLNNLTDNAIPTSSTTGAMDVGAEAEAHQQLRTTAHELLEVMQNKMGPKDFIAEMQHVQKSVTERREDRRAKRRIEAISNPEKAGREKAKKHEVKKVKRREKNSTAAGRRRGW